MDKTRRSLLNLGPALFGAAVGASMQARAQPIAAPARGEGPAVWLDLTQAELDAAYDQVQYAPNQPQILKRYASRSDAARTALGSPRRFAYGDTAIEQLDVFAPAATGAPINVFLHGGAWRHGSARDYAFPAESFVRAGAVLVVPDFVWVHEAGGNLMVMAEQVQRAVAWVFRNAQRIGGDPQKIFISGHSSGAHLAAVALTTDWAGEHRLPHDLLKGGLCCSGLFDLKPVRLSARNAYVKFTDEIEDAMSPQRHLDRLHAPLIVAHGTLETPEFQRQSREFAAAVKAAGKPVQLLVGDSYNHFEIIETMANPYGLLGRAVLHQMKLA